MITLLCLSCSHRGAEQSATSKVQTIRPIGWGNSNYVPKATVFQMNGDYADKVGVTLNPDGSLAYYPDPTDISPANSTPVALADGWWLNRQGLSDGSVFTRWTFAEYAAMKQPPSQAEIIEAIIPDARVTEMLTLPVTLSEALADPNSCNTYLP